MFGVIRRMLQTGDPTQVLAENLAQGQEGVNWVATATPGPVDLSELTEAERALLPTAEQNKDFAFYNAHIGPKEGTYPAWKTILDGAERGMTFEAYDPDTAVLTYRDAAGEGRSLTAHWIMSLRPNRNFQGLLETEWSTALTASRGKGMRPALVARAYADTANIPGLSAHDRNGTADNLPVYLRTAIAFFPGHEPLALAETPETTRYFIANFPEDMAP